MCCRAICRLIADDLVKLIQVRLRPPLQLAVPYAEESKITETTTSHSTLASYTHCTSHTCYSCTPVARVEHHGVSCTLVCALAAFCDLFHASPASSRYTVPKQQQCCSADIGSCFHPLELSPPENKREEDHRGRS